MNRLEILHLESGEYYTMLSNKYRHRKLYMPKSYMIIAAIPGIVLSVKVEEGQSIKRGDVLFVLDSMKMNNIICSDRDGVIKKIYIKVGESVAKGTPIIEWNCQ